MLNELKTKATRLACRTGLKLKKYSPEILITLGVIGFITTVVLASKATLKLDETIEEDAENLEVIKSAKEAGVENYQHELLATYSKIGLKVAKLYALPTATGLASVGCFVGAHVIMDKRNAALTGSLIAVQTAFAKYRQSVIDAEGLIADEKYLHGVEKAEVTKTELDEKGKPQEVKEIVNKAVAPNVSPYARFFDESSVYWQKGAEYNAIFLKRQQAAANDMLHIRGHIFLNEVYDMLGIPRSQLGSVVGWVYNGDGDNYVDFGMTDINREKVRDFVNGYERSILLDFNVDGVIYDKI